MDFRREKATGIPYLAEFLCYQKNPPELPPVRAGEAIYDSFVAQRSMSGTLRAFIA